MDEETEVLITESETESEPVVSFESESEAEPEAVSVIDYTEELTLISNNQKDITMYLIGANLLISILIGFLFIKELFRK